MKVVTEHRVLHEAITWLTRPLLVRLPRGPERETPRTETVDGPVELVDDWTCSAQGELCGDYEEAFDENQ